MPVWPQPRSVPRRPQCPLGSFLTANRPSIMGGTTAWTRTAAIGGGCQRHSLVDGRCTSSAGRLATTRCPALAPGTFLKVVAVGTSSSCRICKVPGSPYNIIISMTKLLLTTKMLYYYSCIVATISSTNFYTYGTAVATINSTRVDGSRTMISLRDEQSY